jgi:hypothetical protein
MSDTTWLQALTPRRGERCARPLLPLKERSRVRSKSPPPPDSGDGIATEGPRVSRTMAKPVFYAAS